MGIQLTARRQSIMALQALLVTALASSCIAAPTAPVYAPAPAYAPVEPTYPDEAPVYQYTYAVKDDYSFVNFNANEERDGYNAAGSYQVALPDGRTQTVTYTATKDGYVAEVSYQGEAQYPEYKPNSPAAPVYAPAPAPVYHAAPVYAPAPAPVVYKPAAPVVKAAEEPATEAAPAAAPAEESAAPKEAEATTAATEDIVDLRTDDEPAAPAEEKADDVAAEEAAPADA